MPPDELEQLERTVFEMVVQAFTDYRDQAVEIFREDTDLPQDIAEDIIWLAGRNAPTLGEDFRVRLSYERLMAKADWRVREIPLQDRRTVNAFVENRARSHPRSA